MRISPLRTRRSRYRISLAHCDKSSPPPPTPPFAQEIARRATRVGSLFRPSGRKTLAALLPRGCGPSLALALASEINPSDAAPLACFSAALVDEAASTLRKSCESSASRERVGADLAKSGRIFQKLRVNRMGRLPSESPTRRLNFPLIHFLLRAFEFTDAALRPDLSHMVKLHGGLPLCLSVAKRASSAPRTRCELLTGLYRRNRRISRCSQA